MNLTPIRFDNEIAKLTEKFSGREWVFEKIDNWLKHEDKQFLILVGVPGVGKSAIVARLTQIRKDIAAYHFCIAREGGTINPNNVLLSLASQLIEYFPEYGEALVNTIKPLKLEVKVEIDIQTIKESRVQAIVIQNLYPGEPQEALNIVLRQPLAALPEPEQPKIILIDSLDEAVTFIGRENLVTLLSGASDLKPWVRFILTSRSERRVLSRLDHLKPYIFSIDEKCESSLNDIWDYATERVKSEGIQSQLKKYEVDSQTLVNKLTDLSTGNFLYTKVLLNDIENDGENDRENDRETDNQPLDNLEALPKSLDEFYHGFLVRFTEDEWNNRYQPVFGVLTVTQEPITEKQLANFTNTDSEDIRKSMRIGRQFFDVVKEDNRTEAYSLFHQSLRDYLLNKERNQDFWCDPLKHHRRIVDYYHKKSESWTDLRQVDKYALRHLARHLVKAESEDELHTLLALKTSEQRNAWFEVKDNVTEYLADISLAWQIVEQEFTNSQSSQTIGLQCRYALITSSINSLTTNLPPALIIELTKKDSVKGLTYIRPLILNQHKQSLQILKTLTSQIIEPDLVQKLLEIAEAISNKEYQTQVQSALAKYLSGEKLTEVFEVAQAIQNEEDRADVISMLIPYLPSEKHLKILEATQAIRDEYYRAKVFSTLTQYLPKDWFPDILKIIRKIKSTDYRTDALIGAIPHLPEKLLPEALKVILEVPGTSEFSQKRALCRLAAASNLTIDMLRDIQKAAEAFQNKNFRIQVCCALEPHLFLDQLSKVVEEGDEIQDFLSALVSRLPSDQLHKILEQAQAIESERMRSEVLSSLISHLPPNLLCKVLEEVKKIQNESNRYLVLSKLATAPNLSIELRERIQEQAEAFQDKDYRDQVLSNLAPYLSLNQLYKLLEKVKKIQDECDRSLVLRRLAPYLPQDQLCKVLEEVQKIQDECKRSLVLSKLATAFNLSTELQERIQKQAEAIQDKDCRTIVLSSIAQNLSEEQQLEVLEAAREIQDEQYKAEALRALVPYLSSDQQAKILKTVIEFHKWENQTQVLSILNPYLSSDQLHEILEEVQAIPDEYNRCLTLSSLTAYLPPNQLYNLLEQVEALQNEKNQTKVLSRLVSAPNLTTDLREKIQKQVEAFQNKCNRIQILSLLAPYLQPKEQHKIFEEVQAIQDEYNRSLALSRLVPSLPSNQLQEVLKATQENQDKSYRYGILRVLAPELAKFPHDELYRLWSSTLHILAKRSREDLLADIRELTPVIFNIGKHEAMVKIWDAIWEIGQQWP